MADHIDDHPPSGSVNSPDAPGSNAAPAAPNSPPLARVPLWQARLAGAVAAGVALAVGELVSALSGTDQSLIAGVGTTFIDQFAAALKDLAVSLFGTNDKAALVIGIVVVGVGLGAALGVASLRRPWVGPAGFAAFGAVGLVAGLRDPQSAKGLVVFAALAATGAGIATLWLLLRVAATGSILSSAATNRSGTTAAGATPRLIDRPTDPAATRRAFFGWAGAAGLFAVGASLAGRALSGRSKAEVARDTIKLPAIVNRGPGVSGPTTAAGANPEAPLGVNGLSPYYVPNKDFYRIDTALVVPQLDPETWRLKITGMVDHPYELSFDDLLKLPQIEESVTLSCVSNEIGGDLVGNAVWQGVPLQVVLDRAGVQSGATQIVGSSVDDFTAGFPTQVGLDGRVAMIAIGMNGEPLPIPHGFPARLVVAGLYGYVSATKWLTEIHLTTWEAFNGYWVPRGWSKEAPIKTSSRIDVPSTARIATGATKIAGVAWAPTRGIKKVEVQVDNDPWQEATLADTVSANTWVQWVHDWNAPAGEHTLRVRATDGTGETQTSEQAFPDPNGATGWHTKRVRVEA